MSEKENSHNKIQWFFLVIFIPIVFTIILITVILSLLGFNVIDKAKEFSSNIPIVTEYFSNDDKAVEEVDVVSLEQTISEQQAEVDQLQKEIERKDEEIARLGNEMTQLEQSQIVEAELANQAQQELDNIAKTYESMKPKNAANIISALPGEEALLHLSQVSIELRAEILEEMDSEQAASFMSRLANQ
ncbi:MotE family protein [Halalkalibacter nanhaiisediminis]|nr:MotE family protein [Halalkalibacter nanhaiisediminis]